MRILLDVVVVLVLAGIAWLFGEDKMPSMEEIQLYSCIAWFASMVLLWFSYRQMKWVHYYGGDRTERVPYDEDEYLRLKVWYLAIFILLIILPGIVALFAYPILEKDFLQ